jgi:hypothetical protein
MKTLPVMPKGGQLTVNDLRVDFDWLLLHLSNQSIACFDPEVFDRMDPTRTLCDVLSGYAAKEVQKSVTNRPV